MGANKYAVYGAMILVQFAYAGANVLTKLALAEGLDQFVFVVYRHVIGLLVLAPFAYIFERNRRPRLSFPIMLKIFALACVGTTIHLNVYYAGLRLTSPTVASALSNVTPTLTFLMAVLIRIEKVKIRSNPSRAKVIGTLLCIGGSLVFTLWRGKYVFKGFKSPLLSIHGFDFSAANNKHGEENWIKGSSLILVSFIALSAWFIFQVKVYAVYPAILSLNALTCAFASLQSSLLALFFSRDINSWRLEWNVQLLNILYCGVVLSALMNFLLLWCISKRGPVFAVMFNPLQLIIVGLFSAIAFAERLPLGSLIGTFMIIFGLYCFLWGKQAEGVTQKNTQGFTAEITGNHHHPETDDESEGNERDILKSASDHLTSTVTVSASKV